MLIDIDLRKYKNVSSLWVTIDKWGPGFGMIKMKPCQYPADSDLPYRKIKVSLIKRLKKLSPKKLCLELYSLRRGCRFPDSPYDWLN
jgi:hypothetical protein